MSRIIIVLGTHRTGTSCIAGMLHRLGVNMGEGHLMTPTPANPKGHYEDNRFYRLNDEMIKKWWEPVLLPTDEIIKKYRNLIDTVSADNTVWGMKDPRLCITLEEVYPLMEEHDVRIVRVDRDFADASQSLVKRDGLDRKMAQKIQYGYLASRQDFLDDHPDLPITTITYERTLAWPLDVAKILNEFAMSDMQSPDDERVTEAASFVDVKLNHGSDR